MKLLTRELFNKPNSTGWARAFEKYSQYLRDINGLLPDSIRRLSKVQLHDCIVIAVDYDIAARQVAFDLQGFTIVFLDATLSQPVRQVVKDVWLLFEVTAVENGVVRMGILLDESEFMLTCRNVRVYDKGKRAWVIDPLNRPTELNDESRGRKSRKKRR